MTLLVARLAAVMLSAPITVAAFGNARTLRPAGGGQARGGWRLRRRGPRTMV